MKMRVLHVNSELGWRGGERQIELLTDHTSKYVASIIACQPNGQLKQRLSETHQVIDFPIRNGLDIKAAFNLKKLSLKVDLIHCHTPKAQSIAVLSKLIGNNRPIVCTKRTSFQIGNNYLSRFKYQKTDQIVCVSQASAIALGHQVPGLKVKVIHSAIERLTEVKPVVLEKLIPETTNKQVIGYVAAITEEKNLSIFLKTAQSVLAHHPNTCFLWIGDGALKTKLHEQIKGEQLSDHIILPGFQNNIEQWIAALDLLFFPSTSEGFPTTLLQAMQLAVPVIASDIPGIREIICHNENGLLNNANDAEGFAEKIIEVLGNKALRKKLTSSAFGRLKPFYAQSMAQQYIDLYQHLLK